MSYRPNVSGILDKMREISKSGSKVYHFGMIADYGVIFSDGCTAEQIKELELKAGLNLPDDYREFLLYTNGLELLSNYVSAYLFDLDNMYRIRECMPRPENFLVIGAFAESAFNVAINLTDDSSNNMYVVDAIADEHFSRLNCSFTTFLDRFMVTYGAVFWEWGAVETNIKQCDWYKKPPKHRRFL